MSPKQINEAIGAACGWKWKPKGDEYGPLCHPWIAPDGSRQPALPDYYGSLDAMHCAEKVIIAKDLISEYVEALEELCFVMRAGVTYEDYTRGVGWGHEEWFHVTAPQRAEAFLRAVGKWEEAPK